MSLDSRLEHRRFYNECV